MLITSSKRVAVEATLFAYVKMGLKGNSNIEKNAHEIVNLEKPRLLMQIESNLDTK